MLKEPLSSLPSKASLHSQPWPPSGSSSSLLTSQGLISEGSSQSSPLFPLGPRLDPACGLPLCSQLLHEASSGAWVPKSLRTRWPWLPCRPWETSQPAPTVSAPQTVLPYPQRGALWLPHSPTPTQQWCGVSAAKTLTLCLPEQPEPCGGANVGPL